MASGCPVINTAIPDSGVSWVSAHGGTGLTVPVNDPAAFAAAANRLLGDRELRARLSEGARRRAIEMFADRTMAARTLDVYAEVIEERTGQDAPACYWSAERRRALAGQAVAVQSLRGAGP
jgi:rhamnosyl/mannosyltransferase